MAARDEKVTRTKAIVVRIRKIPIISAEYHAEINCRVAQPGTTKINDPVDAAATWIKHDVIRRNVGIHHFQFIFEITLVSEM